MPKLNPELYGSLKSNVRNLRILKSELASLYDISIDVISL